VKERKLRRKNPSPPPPNKGGLDRRKVIPKKKDGSSFERRAGRKGGKPPTRKTRTVSQKLRLTKKSVHLSEKKNKQEMAKKRDRPLFEGEKGENALCGKKGGIYAKGEETSSLARTDGRMREMAKIWTNLSQRS